jgi:hypothetical protein
LRVFLKIGTASSIRCVLAGGDIGDSPWMGRAARGILIVTSRAFPKSESYGMLETAASVGWKVKDAIVWFHGIGRLALSDCVASNGEVLKWDCLD